MNTGELEWKLAGYKVAEEGLHSCVFSLRGRRIVNSTSWVLLSVSCPLPILLLVRPSMVRLVVCLVLRPHKPYNVLDPRKGGVLATILALGANLVSMQGVWVVAS